MAQEREPDADWWSSVRDRGTREPLEPRTAVRIGGCVFGSIALPLLDKIVASGLPLSSDGCIEGEPSAALARIADWLRETGRAGAWRDEQLAVVSAQTGCRLATVERAVARNLGLHTHSVQLHARSAEGLCWLQQRSLDKATDPGRWDTLSAGLISADESVLTALHRETWEEAGIRIDDALRGLRSCGTFTVRRPVADSGDHGYLMETVHAFDATLVPGQVPSNQDGEVIAFETFSDAQIDALVQTGQLTLEAAVAIALSRASI